jgi:hypothetical protein
VLAILMFKGLTPRRLCKLLGVKELSITEIKIIKYLCSAKRSLVDSVRNLLILAKKEMLRYWLCCGVTQVIRYLNCEMLL